MTEDYYHREYYRLKDLAAEQAAQIEALNGDIHRLGQQLEDGPFAAIPENHFWMAAKGRLKPSEPLYAVQIIDAESGVHVAAAEAETLEDAIAASLQALADAAVSRS